MNIASLVNPPKARLDSTSPGRLQVARVQVSVLAQGAVSALKDSVMAFRFMRGVLTGTGLASAKVSVRRMTCCGALPS